MYHIKISNITVFDIELLKSLEHILPKGQYLSRQKKKLSSLSTYLVIFYHVSKNTLFPPVM